jgi:hypothetical protein
MGPVTGTLSGTALARMPVFPAVAGSASEGGSNFGSIEQDATASLKQKKQGQAHLPSSAVGLTKRNRRTRVPRRVHVTENASVPCDVSGAVVGLAFDFEMASEVVHCECFLKR